MIHCGHVVSHRIYPCSVHVSHIPGPVATSLYSDMRGKAKDMMDRGLRRYASRQAKAQGT